jgi:hypothetical protein
MLSKSPPCREDPEYGGRFLALPLLPFRYRLPPLLYNSVHLGLSLFLQSPYTDYSYLIDVLSGVRDTFCGMEDTL